MSRPTKCLHWKDAIALLESGQPVDIKLWKLTTGDILHYKRAVCIGTHWRGGTHLIKLTTSDMPRTLRDITMFEINGYEIIR